MKKKKATQIGLFRDKLPIFVEYLLSDEELIMYHFTVCKENGERLLVGQGYMTKNLNSNSSNGSHSYGKDADDIWTIKNLAEYLNEDDLNLLAFQLIVALTNKIGNYKEISDRKVTTMNKIENKDNTVVIGNNNKVNNKTSIIIKFFKNLFGL